MEIYETYNSNLNSYPIVVSIPHSGRYIPLEIKERFNQQTILPNMDWYLDILYEFLQQMNITTIVANYSRYVIDLNRSLNLKDGMGDYRNTLVYTKTTFNKSIYNSPLSMDDITNRIEAYYLPFYRQLEELIKNKLCIFKKVYLLDLHSFFQQSNYDICLGNVRGVTSTDKTLTFVKNALLNEGFSVDENNVFTGGHIIRHFREKFLDKLECIALELRYTAYLEERYFREEEVVSWDENSFSLTQNKLKRAFSQILNIGN